ncbi:MAG TPA: SDR family NAD(P)-dependent oxidoreductase, partial [Haloferula sp.]
MDRTTKTALITGASSGIGYELAKVFAQEGHDLVLVARSEDQLIRIAQDFEQHCGVKVRVIAKDLFEPNAAHELYEQVRHEGI